MIQRRQNARRLLGRADVARVLVFKTDDQVLFRRPIGEVAEMFDDGIEAGFRLNGLQNEKTRTMGAPIRFAMKNARSVSRGWSA